MRQVMAITNALADEGRVRALLALRHGELCVCQIVELLGLAPSTVSKHLALLKAAGLVETRKEGRWIYYTIGDEAGLAGRGAVEWLAEALDRDERIIADRARLKAILKEDPEEICRRQMGRPECCSSARATRAAARWPRGGRVRSRAT